MRSETGAPTVEVSDSPESVRGGFAATGAAPSAIQQNRSYVPSPVVGDERHRGADGERINPSPAARRLTSPPSVRSLLSDAAGPGSATGAAESPVAGEEGWVRRRGGVSQPREVSRRPSISPAGS